MFIDFELLILTDVCKESCFLPLIFISGTKDGFEEMDYSFHLDIFCLHKQDYLFRNALALLPWVKLN